MSGRCFTCDAMLIVVLAAVLPACIVSTVLGRLWDDGRSTLRMCWLDVQGEIASARTIWRDRYGAEP